MKKYIIIITLTLLCAGCSDFLDVDNLTQKNSDNFPTTPDEAYTALMGVYNGYASNTNDGWRNFFVLAELMSDDRFGGGGQNDRHAHAVNAFRKMSSDMYGQPWAKAYTTIYRANLLLESLDRITWSNDAQRKSIEGQVCFLRAFSYFDLCRMFGTVPLLLKTERENKPRASADELYAQMGSDLKKAIESIPAVPFANIPKDEIGLASKWAAEALMARVFLFYTGYYGKEAILSESVTITKNDVIGWLDDCINNSGHELLPDFRSLWPYSYSNKDYGYAKKNGLTWIGEEGNNKETVFAIKYSVLGSKNKTYCNDIVLHFGLRAQSWIPFGQGWGLGTVNPQLFQEWPDEDLRKKGSIYDVNDPNEGVSGFTWDGDMQYHETGYWQKKYMPINVYDANNRPVNYSCILYGMSPNYQQDNTQDLILIRFADVLLMATELGGPDAQKYLDMVRDRVHLTSVPATLENIKKERRYELAFEGVRYYDLLRWHDAETAFAKVRDIPVLNNGVQTGLTIEFRPVTGGFLPIPDPQIQLSGGVLEQNPGWTDAESLF